MNPFDTRGTGRTTRAIENLEANGVLIILPSTRLYTRDLIHHLGRGGVTLVSWTEIRDPVEFAHRFINREIEVDHAVWEYGVCTPRDRAILDEVLWCSNELRVRRG